MSSARTNVRLLLSSNSCSCQAKFEHLFDMGREDALMARKITKRQQQIYDFIKEYQQEKGYPPACARWLLPWAFPPPAPCTPISLPWRRAGYSARCHQTARLELFNEDGSSVSISKSDEPPHLAERSRYRSLVASRLGFPFWPSRISKTRLLSRPKSH